MESPTEPRNTGTASSYDEAPYESAAFPQTQPDRLSVLATLFALDTVLPSRARVLEIGCAAGGNLIPLAFRYPDAHFTGIDLSRRQIEDGRRDAAALGLRNVELLEKDLMDVDASFGSFDYIVAHGVYSWIPAPVRAKLLDIFRANLSEQGVAYVSYNTLPGWRLRGVVRDMMRYHAGSIEDPRRRAAQARAMLEFLQTSLEKQLSAYANLLREESRALAAVSDSYLLHDHLEEENDPVYFHQFFAQITAAGLNFLCEDELLRSVPELVFAPEVAKTVRRIAPDLVSMEQYTDFLTNRTFRQSLLVRAGRQLDRAVDPQRVSDLFVASKARPATAGADIRSTSVVRYTTPEGSAISLSRPLTKTALDILSRCWPETLAFTELRDRSNAALGRATPDPAETRALASDLLNALTIAAVSLHREPLLAVNGLCARPVAFEPARYYASLGGKRLPNARHGTVPVDDMASVLIQLLDGTRDQAALTEAMVERVLNGKINISEKGGRVSDPHRAREIMAGSVTSTLNQLAEDAFLVG